MQACFAMSRSSLQGPPDAAAPPDVCTGSAGRSDLGRVRGRQGGARGRYALALALALAGLPDGLRGQTLSDGSIIREGHLRIIFPEDSSAKGPFAARILAMLPPDLSGTGLGLSSSRITVDLVRDVPANIRGTSDAPTRTITLPYPASRGWSDEQLRVTLTHEVAHIALGDALRGGLVPVWFEEGYAEWVAGGPNCRAQARLALDLIRRDRTGAPPPSFTRGGLGRGPVAYDYYASIFEYFEQRGKGVVSDGHLLRSVLRSGVMRGVASALGIREEDLDQGWQEFLTARYQDVPAVVACTDAAQPTSPGGE